MTLLGTKLGMSTLQTPAGAAPVTLIHAASCVVTQVKTEEKDGYNAIQVGYGTAKKLNKPQKGHLQPSGSQARKIGEFRCADISGFEVGQKLDVSVLAVGDKVKVSGVSKGRGFSGVVRRHNFAGGLKTHGQSDRWRAPGSIGAGTSPGRVLRGTRMAGQYGNKPSTTKGLKIVDILPEDGILLIKGAVPGVKGSFVKVEKMQ